MRDLDLSELRTAFGLGVAGNFAGHLEQAGEAGDFRNVRAGEGEAPKGIFPWHQPGGRTFLGTFPITDDALELPPDRADLRLQIEPEVGVLASVEYDAQGRVTGLSPFAAGAFNDCSIRRPAERISEKKNWGPASKGLASRAFDIADVDPDGGLRHLRIACFLRRGDDVHEYGVDSPAAGYSYAGARLVDWIVDRLHHQVAAPGTPLEDVGALLRESGCPATIVIGIGATRYTDFGEHNFLGVGDESVVVVYDDRMLDNAQVAAAVAARSERELVGASVLSQRVGAAALPD